VKTKTLGVLLPLSGTYQSHGQSALEAIQVALQGKDVILKVRDTAGTPEQAQAAAQALIMKEGVVALVGPIGLRESRAALEVSAAFGVAHAVLANRPELTEGIETAVRLGVSQSEEAAGLAKHAWIEMGIKRIAILGPRGQHEPTAFAFWDAFVRLGGEVRGVELYDKDLKDLKEVISRLLVIRDDGRLEPDFEALFIPAGPKALKRLLGYLSFHQIDPRRAPNERAKAKRFLVQLLGPHAWNTRSTIHTQRLTDNAVFTDGFSDHESLSIAHRFSEVFRKRYRRGPSAFEARVHDTMTLFVQCLGEIGGTDRSRREQFLERLYAARHLEGTTGTISVIKDVGVLLKPRILTLDGKEIRPRLSEDEETVLRR
jgi:ABC-type branched-subunit amino acid transport system substrate-binding protein